MPLIQNILTRCSFIMNHLFDIAVQVIVQEEPTTIGIVGRYEDFVKELSKFQHFSETRTNINIIIKMEWATYITRGVAPHARGRKLIGGNWKCNG